MALLTILLSSFLYAAVQSQGYGLPPGVEDLQSDALPIVDAKITTPSIEALESYVAVQAEQQMKGAANAILRQLANPTKGTTAMPAQKEPSLQSYGLPAEVEPVAQVAEPVASAYGSPVAELTTGASTAAQDPSTAAVQPSTMPVEVTSSTASTQKYVLNEKAAEAYWSTAIFPSTTEAPSTAATIAETTTVLDSTTQAAQEQPSTLASQSYGLPSEIEPAPLTAEPIAAAYGAPIVQQTTTESSTTVAADPSTPEFESSTIPQEVTTAPASTQKYVLNEKAAAAYWATATFPSSSEAPSTAATTAEATTVSESTTQAAQEQPSTVAPQSYGLPSEIEPVAETAEPIVSAYRAPVVEQTTTESTTQAAQEVPATLAPQSYGLPTEIEQVSETADPVASAYGTPVVEETTTAAADPSTTAMESSAIPQEVITSTQKYVLNEEAAAAYWATATFPSTTEAPSTAATIAEATTVSESTTQAAQEQPSTFAPQSYGLPSEIEPVAETAEPIVSAYGAAVVEQTTTESPTTVAEDPSTTEVESSALPQEVTTASTQKYVLNEKAAAAYWATATFPSTTEVPTTVATTTEAVSTTRAAQEQSSTVTMQSYGLPAEIEPVPLTSEPAAVVEVTTTTESESLYGAISNVMEKVSEDLVSGLTGSSESETTATEESTTPAAMDISSTAAALGGYGLPDVETAASDVTVSPTMPPTAAVAVGGYGLPEGADFSSHPKNIGASR